MDIGLLLHTHSVAIGTAGIGLLLAMHGVAIGTQWALACCFACMVCHRNTVGIGFVASHAWCCHRNTVGIGLLLHMHGVAIGTEWTLACCLSSMLLP